MISLKNIRVDNSIEEAFRRRCTKKLTRSFKTFHLNISWGIWLTRNLKLFDKKEISHLKCVVQAPDVLKYFP